MAERVIIRQARPEDAAAVASLSGELGYPIDVPTAHDRIAASDGVTLLVAEDGADGVIGWIEIAPRRSIEIGAVAEIQGLVVTAGRRGSSVGSRLLNAAEDWARTRRFDRIRVRSNVVRDRTHAFYLARGYSERKRQVVFDKTLASNAD